jgi:predicted aspartyl protease
MTVIEKQTAERLGLSDKASGTRDALGAGGALVATMLTVESIKVDNVEAKNIRVGVMDLSTVAKCGCLGELGGILGYNFVKDHRVLIDYPKQEIIFEKD